MLKTEHHASQKAQAAPYLYGAAAASKNTEFPSFLNKNP